jgi:hypothetical protein
MLGGDRTARGFGRPHLRHHDARIGAAQQAD